MKASISKAEPLSFEDAYGATVSIPCGEVVGYAGIRAEQLNQLTMLLAGGVLPESSVQAFTVMANELAIAVNSLMDLVADDVRNSMKGGA